MNLEDIAKLAGVSRSTVSRVINNEPNVSDAVRQRVQRTIDEIGYKPNAAARALASHRSSAIGLVVPEDFSRYHVDTWYPLIIEATLAATRDAGLSLMLIMEDTFSPGAGRRVIEQFINTRRVEGLLALTHSYDDHLTRPLLQANAPLVLIAESNIPGAVWVDNDNFALGKELGQRMREAGATTATVFTGYSGHVPSLRRIEGFSSQLPDIRSVACPFSHVEALALIRQTLADPSHRPDAVFAVNGWLAPLVYRAASDLGITIPDDMLAATFDDFDADLNEALGVTSAVQQTTTLAERAVHCLTELIEGRSPPPATRVLESTIVTRGSCREFAFAAGRGGELVAE